VDIILRRFKVKKKVLEQLNGVLLEAKEEILENLNFTTNEIKNLKDVEIKDEGDDVVVGNGKNIDAAISKRQVKRLKDIDTAISKIHNGGYGVCEMCEEKISLHRLQAKPYAKYCIICREFAEKSRK